MATAGNSGVGDKQAAAYPGGDLGRQPSRWKRNLTVLALLAIAGWLAWAWQGLREEGLVGAAYGARVGCVCRFVSQRPLAACQGDIKIAGLRGIAARVSLSDDAQRRTVTASVPLLARQSANFNENRGCQLEPWQD